jgi:beta-galactosidase
MTDFSRRELIQGTLGTAFLAVPGRLLAQPSPDLHPPIVPRFPHILHGGDWSPEQWLDEPGVIEDDFRLMQKAGCNTFSVGIFSWSHLEPEEGRFTFEWLDRILDGLAERGMLAFLATPSGAKPRWMSEKYPEVRRITAEGHRELHAGRHNHCFTSPVYRAKVRAINGRLAKRYGKHKALAAWHISNEYNGACYCELCLRAFRSWLKARYGSLPTLNKRWWTSFWSQTFQAWEQIDPRQTPVDGLLLDWERFATHQTVDFMKAEIQPLRAATPTLPITTNMMGVFPGIDYRRFTDLCDRMSWDAYPRLHGKDSWRTACELGFTHDIYRAMKGGRPFILMESTPSNTNWYHTPMIKKPGQHHQEMLLAIGHGADTTMFFQWRKSRGAFEKFHGAAVDHEGSERTRVFQDVAAHGAALKKLDGVVGTTVRPEVAVFFEWDTRWALRHSQGPRRARPPAPATTVFEKEYLETCVDHYRPFWKLGVPVDVIESIAPFDGYRLVVAPMMFMVKPNVVERLTAFVKGGGTLVLTYLSGIVDETNLALRGGWPGGGLRALAGVWAEELDSLYPDSPQRIVPAAGNPLGLSGEHPVRDYCDRVHAETAQVLATYKTDFYAGQPCLTVNRHGAGRVYYLGTRPAADPFHDAFTRALVRQLGIARCLESELPEGVTVQKRTGGGRTFLFLHNLKPMAQSVDVGGPLEDVLGGRTVRGRVSLPAYGSLVLRRL